MGTCPVFYMQMAQNLRRYKGARPNPKVIGTNRIEIDGDFADWADIKVEYRDTVGDTARLAEHRRVGR